MKGRLLAALVAGIVLVNAQEVDLPQQGVEN